MKTVSLSSLSLVVILCCQSVTRADYVTSYFQPFGTTTDIHDRSLENITDASGNPTSQIAVGDILTGTVSYSYESTTTGTSPTFPSTIQVTAYFQEKVTSIAGSAPSYTIDFAPTTAFQNTYGTGAIAALYENDNSTPYTTLINNASNTQTLANYVNAATSGTLLAVVGFTGTNGQAQNGEGWQATSVTTLSTVDSSSTANIGFYSANLNLITATPALLNSPNYVFASDQTSSFAVGQNTQFSITGHVFTQQSTAPNSGVFPIGDGSDVFFDVNVVPEPSSLTLLAFGGFGLIGAAWRRRHAAVA